jgi:hypothetical protein
MVLRSVYKLGMLGQIRKSRPLPSSMDDTQNLDGFPFDSVSEEIG